MSRSYRHGFQCAGDKGYKKIFNRKIRRNNKQELFQMGEYKKVNNSWDIADYKIPLDWDTYSDWNDDVIDEERWARYKRDISK